MNMVLLVFPPSINSIMTACDHLTHCGLASLCLFCFRERNITGGWTQNVSLSFKAPPGRTITRYKNYDNVR